jgi:glycogen phosphorylase
LQKTYQGRCAKTDSIKNFIILKKNVIIYLQRFIHPKMLEREPIRVAYFSMEFALSGDIPNYAGGLGVLAADIVQSFADMDFRGVGVSLIYHQDEDVHKAFHAEKFMTLLPQSVTISIEGRDVKVGVYEYTVMGKTGKTVPIYFLTTNFPENKKWDRDLTKNLYASDQYTRFGQEVILGIGGVRILRALGYNQIEYFHMNEGHSAFLTFERLRETNYSDDEVRSSCAFTTHTPIAAGHDYFDYPLVQRVLGTIVPWHIKTLATQDRLSMTHLALSLSSKSNSVSERHREVCRQMFPGYNFENITNGVNHLRWVSPSMALLFDKFLPEWKKNPSVFGNAERLIPNEDLLNAHQTNKNELISWINANPDFFPVFSRPSNDDLFDTETLTITFARRFVPYKRPTLVFRDIEKLKDIGYKKIQFIFAGRCHPDDFFCNHMRDDLRKYAKSLRGQIRIAIIPNYTPEIAKKIVSGSDIWLNNPIRPREASGTSGMKAALNGLPNLSVLDGWWIEGLAEKRNAGWGFGEQSENLDESHRDDEDAKELYACLEEAIRDYSLGGEIWTKKMKASIALMGIFNTERVVNEYIQKMWLVK